MIPIAFCNLANICNLTSCILVNVKKSMCRSDAMEQHRKRQGIFILAKSKSIILVLFQTTISTQKMIVMFLMSNCFNLHLFTFFSKDACQICKYYYLREPLMDLSYDLGNTQEFPVCKILNQS